MPTVVKQEAGAQTIWIIKGDTRPYKDVLSAAGAVWTAQRLCWEYRGNTLPEAIQAAFDGDKKLPDVVPPPKSFPIFEQYTALRALHPDHILLFQIGDFYELFETQAEQIATVLDLVLTTRPMNASKERTPMAGFPVHALEKMLSKLLEAGLNVAIADQVSEPTGKGLIERQITRVLSPVGEPNWNKLTDVLDDLRHVLRGHQTREEMTAWVHAVNTEARRFDQDWETNIARNRAKAVGIGLPAEAGAVIQGEFMRPENDAFVQLASGGTVQTVQKWVVDATTPLTRIRFYSVVVPKRVQTRKKALKALIDADAVGIVQYNTAAYRWSVLWNTGVVEIMSEDDIELASDERRAKLLPAVEGATVLCASAKRVSRGKLLRLKPSGKWEVELEGGTRVSEYDKGMIVLPSPPEQLYTVKETRISTVQAWNVIFTDSGEIVIDELADESEANQLAQMLNTQGITDLAHAKLAAEAWNSQQVKPNGDVMDLLWKNVLGTIKDRALLESVLKEINDEPPPLPLPIPAKDLATNFAKSVSDEAWWIDEDDSVFHDDNPTGDHFAILRGPFTSRFEAEKAVGYSPMSLLPTTMVLPLWTPWSVLVITGEKRIETRDWATDYRGLVIIHSTKTANDEIEWALKNQVFVEALAKHGYRPDNLPLGMAIGTAKLVDCKPTEQLVKSIGTQERLFGSYAPGRFGLIFEEPRLFTTPFPLKGMQGKMKPWSEYLKRMPARVV